MERQCQNPDCLNRNERRKSAKYCSEHCNRTVQSRRKKVKKQSTLLTCATENCYNLFSTWNGRTTYCGKECSRRHWRDEYRRRAAVWRNCDYCFTWYGPSISKTHYVNRSRFCSPQCSQIGGHISRTYGLTGSEYWDIWNSQKGLCQICFTELGDRISGDGGDLWGKSPCIDHDHFTGKVRAILHQRCNVALGQIENQGVQATKNCLIYLEKHSEAV